MKSFILAGLLASVSLVNSLPTQALTDNQLNTQQNIDIILSVLNNPNTTPEQLNKNLRVAINNLCKAAPKALDGSVSNGNCNDEQLDTMLSEIVSAIGSDNPLISDFLSALVTFGIDSDAVTLAAITSGIDATVASEATAAGPGGAPVPAAPVIVTLPTVAVPQGAGGTGGDAGISEVGN
ncbi:hypothetical protein V6257_06110 [Pseudoalteromonas issachenkonii]|uniref:Uncharacterized protein n=1 Tax=Pseudoalteromonas issachenkonii TaxID=152297 RepID=A0ABU9GYU2_9GAMM